MVRGLIVAAALIASALAGAAPGFACSVIFPEDYDHQDALRDAKAKVREATLIIDGEVVGASDGDRAAIVRVERVFKGPQIVQVNVGVRSDCDNSLTRPGERMRMLLDGGPDVYFMRGLQGQPDLVDRLLGSDRTRDWPYAPGRDAPRPW